MNPVVLQRKVKPVQAARYLKAVKVHYQKAHYQKVHYLKAVEAARELLAHQNPALNPVKVANQKAANLQKLIVPVLLKRRQPVPVVQVHKVQRLRVV